MCEFLVSYGCVDAYITLLVAYIRVVVCVFVKYLFCLLFVGMYVNFGLLCMFRCLYSCVCGLRLYGTYAFVKQVRFFFFFLWYCDCERKARQLSSFTRYWEETLGKIR